MSSDDTMSATPGALSIWAPQPISSWSSQPPTRLPYSMMASSLKSLPSSDASVRRDEDIHVEQLLRTLNLNSPEPEFHQDSLALLVDAQRTSRLARTPDSQRSDLYGRSASNSPSFLSSSPALSTPTDLSPARPTFSAKAEQVDYSALAPFSHLRQSIKGGDALESFELSTSTCRTSSVSLLAASSVLGRAVPYRINDGNWNPTPTLSDTPSIVFDGRRAGQPVMSDLPSNMSQHPFAPDFSHDTNFSRRLSSTDVPILDRGSHSASTAGVLVQSTKNPLYDGCLDRPLHPVAHVTESKSLGSSFSNVHEMRRPFDRAGMHQHGMSPPEKESLGRDRGLLSWLQERDTGYHNMGRLPFDQRNSTTRMRDIAIHRATSDTRMRDRFALATHRDVANTPRSLTRSVSSSTYSARAPSARSNATYYGPQINVDRPPIDLADVYVAHSSVPASMGPCNLDSELPYARRTHTCHGHAHSGRPSAGSNFNKGNFTTNHDRPSQGDSLKNDVSSEEYGLGHEPVNFLALLHPAARPSYTLFVTRVLRCADQQASIFLQQKLKGASAAERTRIVDAVCTRGAEMMVHRFGNWAVQRCLEAPATVEERRKIVACMRGRVVELATNCYGCHVLQKTLDCEEHLRLLIVEELLTEDPATTLVNKHASHVWSKIMELSWSPTEDGVPSIFSRINEALRGKWAALACHETGSLVVQHAFENLEYEAKDNIVNELLNRGEHVFSDIVRNQWGAYCVQHILEHGATSHRALALDHLIDNLLDCASDEHGLKSVLKALRLGAGSTITPTMQVDDDFGNHTDLWSREAGSYPVSSSFDMPPSILQRIVKRLTEPARGARRPIIVDLALSATGSQLIASVLGMITNEQRSVLYDCIRRHAVTLRGGKTGSKVIWLFERMRTCYA